MTQTTARDNFYGICGVAAALIVAVAVGMPALKAPSADEQAASQPAPATAAGPVRSAAESVVRPLAQLLQPGTTAGYGV